MKTTLENLKAKHLEIVKISKSGSKSVNNKTILVGLLQTEAYDRKELPVIAAFEFFKMCNLEEVEDEDFGAKVTSMTNSLDTLISNYNSAEKIAKDDLLRGTKLVESNNSYQII